MLLSCILTREEDYVNEVPQQRLVFFTKHIAQQLEIVQPTSNLGAQMLSTLAFTLPPIKDIYGSFWSELLTIIPKTGLQATSDETLFGVYASLRILLLMRKSDIKDANDDLLDAWNENKPVLATALVDLLKQSAGKITCSQVQSVWRMKG